LIAGCCLKALGASGEEAMARVQKARTGTCDRENQQHYLIHTFVASPVDRQDA
jgi:hypothetical protein